MATAKKLPSGSWRCLVYSHTKEVQQPDGTVKKKRIYESFTSDDPSAKGKRQCEKKAAAWAAEKEEKLRRLDSPNITLRQAIDKYISKRGNILSPTTVQAYQSMQKYAFPDIMDMKISKITEGILQEALNNESMRKPRRKSKAEAVAPKTVLNEWGLILTVIEKNREDIDSEELTIPKKQRRLRDLPEPSTILSAVKGSDIELPVLLAIWLSFTMSEIRGLTKSKSISYDGNYISIVEVLVDVHGKPVRKSIAKNSVRNRKHRLPAYIKELINKVEGDVLVPMTHKQIYSRWLKIVEKNSLPRITFHDLRHVSASVMAMLQIPDKYAQDRGGWASDYVMKQVYMETFSSERVRTDNAIDAYFEEIIEPDADATRNATQDQKNA